jgi:hypothetical protein
MFMVWLRLALLAAPAPGGRSVGRGRSDACRAASARGGSGPPVPLVPASPSCTHGAACEEALNPWRPVNGDLSPCPDPRVFYRCFFQFFIFYDTFLSLQKLVLQLW